MIDLETQKSMVLAQFYYDTKHSGNAHAHPTFSNDGKKVIFSMDRGGHMWTAYMDITDIEEIK
ncbi:hypothetical protein [Ructibacterium gallinarum]|uniref:PD40 domain-containing protein n=1 Tax=Ructibacterium gallinarum TaxID=2779355 RepID=A0A9D5RCS4_9FIRM|nr:hypothetical protein [Ructibacterium gallinarum]MBE5041263.1 PD40 domain-containing protein [Ructibacterium gallinarum]